VGRALTELADAVIAAALDRIGLAVPMAVIAMGRLGGNEASYDSDLDLLLVWDGGPDGLSAADSAEAAEASAVALTRLIGGSTPATGAYKVDLNLRPEGRQGATARSLGAYAAYYDRWAQPWERQALLRGRFVAGDPRVGDEFARIVDRFVWARELSTDDVVDIRRMKARIEKERLPAGEDPKFHLKLGPGSMSDVEWTVQLLQLKHRVSATGTLEALDRLVAAGGLSSEDAAVLADAYQFCARTRNRLSLTRDTPGDALPVTGPALTVLARSLGFTASDLRSEYTRLTRRARKVMERLFYGI
jgi:[glutamine synthetase] adenylyltransferase / [glutamine synthetase]-adenylyl-L-tyrosine phosphorylase